MKQQNEVKQYTQTDNEKDIAPMRCPPHPRRWNRGIADNAHEKQLLEKLRRGRRI